MGHSAICNSGSFTRNARVSPSSTTRPMPIQHKPMVNDRLVRLLHSHSVLRKPRPGMAPYSR
ncbi:hypothetical protein D3C77_792050 [compost metagenome]